MKWKSKNSRNFDAVHFNSSRLRSRQALKLRVQRCLSDESELAKKRCQSQPRCRIDVRRSSMPPLKDHRSSSPPVKSVRKSTSPSNLHSSLGDAHRIQKNRSVPLKPCRLEMNGWAMEVHHHNEKRLSSRPPAERFSRSKTMNGRAQHIQEQRSESPDARAHSTERRSAPPTAERVSRSTTMNLHHFRQRSQNIQRKQSVSPDLNAEMNLPLPYSGRSQFSSPNDEIRDEMSIDAKMLILPSFLGKVQSFSQSAQIKDDTTTADAPMSSKSKKRMSFVMVEKASASITRAHHFIKDSARSRSMTNAGNDRTPWHEKAQMPNFLRGRSMRMREPEVKVKDIITADKPQSDPLVGLQIDSLNSKEVKLEKEEHGPPSSTTRRIAGITSTFTGNILQKVRSNQSLCHVANFDEPKQRESVMTVDEDEESWEQMTRELETLGLDEGEDIIEKLASLSYLEMINVGEGVESREEQMLARELDALDLDEEEDINEKLPSLSSEYLGISLSIDSTEPKQSELVMTADEDKESREKQMTTRELDALALHEEEDNIIETLPSLTSEYLVISLFTDSDESSEEGQGADQIPIINSSFTMNDQLPTTGSAERMKGYNVSCNQEAGQYGLLKCPCCCNRIQEAVAGSVDEISRVFDKKVTTTCQRPRLTMGKKTSNPWYYKMQVNCSSFLDSIRESYFDDDDLTATMEQKVLTSKNHAASWDDYTEYDPVEECMSFHLE